MQENGDGFNDLVGMSGVDFHRKDLEKAKASKNEGWNMEDAM
jgi:hypothetical protein